MSLAVIADALVVPAVTVGLETLQWIDPDGETLTLVELRGMTGRMMPPVVFVDEPVPGQPGTRVNYVNDGARQVVVPILLEGSDPSDYRAQIRAIAYAMHARRGVGTLRSTDRDGVQRDLGCYYIDGLGFEENYPDWALPTLLFRAPDPYWYDVDETQADFTTGEPATFFPFFPLRLSSSEVFAAGTVDNGGDVEAWPVWDIVGPGSGLVLRNLTTTKLLALDHPLGVGETVTIDTRPGAKSVTGQDGANLFGDLDTTSSLWPLARSSNSVQVELTDATDESRVSLRYRRRWLSA